MKKYKEIPSLITYNREWANPKGGTLYYFRIEFESGLGQGGGDGFIYCEFGTTQKDQTKFKVGVPVDIEIEEKINAKSNKTYYKIDIIRDSSTGRAFKTPEDQIMISKEVATYCMIETLKNSDVYKISDENKIKSDYFVYLMENKDTPEASSNSLKMAVTELTYLKAKDTKEVIERAKHHLSWYKDTVKAKEIYFA